MAHDDDDTESKIPLVGDGFPDIVPRPATMRLRPVPATDAILFTEGATPEPARITSTGREGYVPSDAELFLIEPIAVMLEQASPLDMHELMSLKTEEDDAIRKHARRAVTEESKEWASSAATVWNSLSTHYRWRSSIKGYRPWPTGPDYYRQTVMEGKCVSPLSIFGEPGGPNDISFLVRFCKQVGNAKMLVLSVTAIAMRAWATINDRYMQHHPEKGEFSDAMPPYLLYLCQGRDFKENTKLRSIRRTALDMAVIMRQDYYEMARRCSITDYVYHILLAADVLSGYYLSESSAVDEPEAEPVAAAAAAVAVKTEKKKKRAVKKFTNAPGDWTQNNLGKQALMYLTTSHWKAMPVSNLTRDVNALMDTIFGNGKKGVMIKEKHRRWFRKRNNNFTVIKPTLPGVLANRFVDHAFPMFIYHLFGSPDLPTLRATGGAPADVRVKTIAWDMARWTGSKEADKVRQATRAWLKSQETKHAPPGKRRKTENDDSDHDGDDDDYKAKPEEEEHGKRKRHQSHNDKDKKHKEYMSACFTRDAATRPVVSAVTKRYTLYSPVTNRLYNTGPESAAISNLTTSTFLSDFDEQSPSHCTLPYMLWCADNGMSLFDPDLPFARKRFHLCLDPASESKAIALPQIEYMKFMGRTLVKLPRGHALAMHPLHAYIIERFNRLKAAFESEAGDKPPVSDVVYAQYQALCCLLTEEKDILRTLADIWVNRPITEDKYRVLLAVLGEGRRAYHYRMESAFWSVSYKVPTIRANAIALIGSWNRIDPPPRLPAKPGFGLIHPLVFAKSWRPLQLGFNDGSTQPVPEALGALIVQIRCEIYAGHIMDDAEIVARHPEADGKRLMIWHEGEWAHWVEFTRREQEIAISQIWLPCLHVLANRLHVPLILCSTPDAVVQWHELGKRKSAFDTLADEVIGRVNAELASHSGELCEAIASQERFDADSAMMLRVLSLAAGASGDSHRVLMGHIQGALERAGDRFSGETSIWKNCRRLIFDSISVKPHTLQNDMLMSCISQLLSDGAFKYEKSGVNVVSRIISAIKSLLTDTDPAVRTTMRIHIGSMQKKAVIPPEWPSNVIFTWLMKELGGGAKKPVAAAAAAAAPVLLVSPPPPPPHAAAVRPLAITEGVTVARAVEAPVIAVAIAEPDGTAAITAAARPSVFH